MTSRRHILFGGTAIAASSLLAGCAPQGQSGAAASSGSSAAGSAAASSAAFGVTVSTPTSWPVPVTAPAAAGAPAAWKNVAQVPHLFFHSLVVDTHRAWEAADEKDGFLDYMVSVDEFARIIPELYRRGYVLVSPHELYEVGKDDVVRARQLMVPAGRTPLILSLDDCSYYEYMTGDGFASRLIVDGDGRVRNEYVDADGKTQVGSYDMVPMLDDFLEQHPDFSLNGARGVLALTGYNGVLGYRTSPSVYGGKPELPQEIEKAKKVVAAMKEKKWEFASHSWSHHSMAKMDMAEFTHDAELWRQDVQPIVGDTDILIYPYGADLAGPEKYTEANEKYMHLRKLGFRSFFLVDGSIKAWGQLQPGYYRGSRINVDGILLGKAVKGERPVVGEFFEAKDVVDQHRPPSIHSPNYTYVPGSPPGDQTGRKLPAGSASAAPSSARPQG